METKTFDTSTLKGLKDAERYKARLENKYDKVTTEPAGLERVRITGQETHNEDMAGHCLWTGNIEAEQ